MKFFEDVRVAAYVHDARLKQDGKTSVVSWRLNLVISLPAQAVYACGTPITSNFEQISAEQNKFAGVDITEKPPAQRITFYKLEETPKADPILSSGSWQCGGLRLTRVEGLIELWVMCEHVMTDSLHKFVKDHAFKRVWAEFVPNQQAPEPSATGTDGPPSEPAQSLASLAGRIEEAGLTQAVLAVVNENAPVNIAVAKAAIKRAKKKAEKK